MNRLSKIILTISTLSMVYGCSTSRAINNKVFLSDAEMILALKKIEKSENSFLLYREGAAGANGGKGGGGCGCN